MRSLMAAMVVAGGMASVGMAQEAAPAMTEEKVKEMVDASIAAIPPKKSWADNVKLKGDLRYRYESIEDDSKKDSDGDTYTRERNRIRARLVAEAKVNDQVSAGIGLSTGQSDPVSGNQSIGDGFGKKEMRLDLGYVEYSALGESANEFKVVGGKMKNPFVTLPEDLVWDGDANPEGIALTSLAGGEGMAKLMLNGGYLWLQERSDKTDSMLYAGQLALKLDFSSAAKLTVGGSYYGFEDVQSYDVIDWEGKNGSYGNSTMNGTVSGSTTNKAYQYEYTPIVYFANLEVWVLGKPITLYGQSLSNDDVDEFDSGEMFGVAFNKLTKDIGSWEIGYSHAELDKDATLGFLTDSDRWGGGTDGEGDRIYAKCQLMKNLQGGVTYLVGERKISDSSKTTDYERLQVDLVASF